MHAKTHQSKWINREKKLYDFVRDMENVYALSISWTANKAIQFVFVRVNVYMCRVCRVVVGQTKHWMHIVRDHNYSPADSLDARVLLIYTRG